MNNTSSNRTLKYTKLKQAQQLATMKVGMILGRMGEGMSRRMIKEGIEVWGYRNNYAKAEEQYEK